MPLASPWDRRLDLSPQPADRELVEQLLAVVLDWLRERANEEGNNSMEEASVAAASIATVFAMVRDSARANIVMVPAKIRH